MTGGSTDVDLPGLPERFVLRREPLDATPSSLVWLADDAELGRQVVVKILRAEAPPETRAAFVEGNRTMARFRHENVVVVFDVGELADGRPWVAMEYLPRSSLSQVLARDGALPVARVVEIGVMLADLLHHLRVGLGTLHRDVKPGNVLVRDSGQVVLTDFGIAAEVPGDGSVTTGQLSDDYAAPEVREYGRYSTASEVYSLGVTLGELLCGANPWRRQPGETASGHRLRRDNGELPTGLLDNAPGLLAVLRRMTATEPRDRFRDLAATATALRSVQAELGLAVSAPIASPVPAEVAPVAIGLDAGAVDGRATGVRPVAPDVVPDAGGPPGPIGSIGGHSAGGGTVTTVRPVATAPVPARAPRTWAVPVLSVLVVVGVLAGGTAVALTSVSTATVPSPLAAPVTPTTAPPTLAQAPPTPTADTADPATSAPAPEPTSAPNPTPRTRPRPLPTVVPTEAPTVHPVTAAVPDPGVEAAPDPTSTPVRQNCFDTAVAGGFALGADQQHVAGGPNHATCGSIHLKLTSATNVTWARSCLETADGSSITSCGGWVRLSYPDTWDTLQNGVPVGSRWQLQMYGDAAETVHFSYTE